MSNQKNKETQKLVRYDLACGSNLQKGFIGIDFTKKGTQAKIEHNLFVTPWPIESNSADELFASHFVEHIPHGTDGFHDPFWDFFNEAWRILKPNGIFRIVTPYYTSGRAFQDPTHQRFITEATFMYLTKAWRKVNRLEHYPINTNFEIVKIDHSVSQEFNGRAQEAVQYAAMHNWNVVDDIIITLKKPNALGSNRK